MRRTGKDFESPATGSEACGGTGMTKEVAFMKGSDGLGEEIRVRIYAVALIDARVRGPVSRCCRRKARRGARRGAADRHAATRDDLAASTTRMASDPTRLQRPRTRVRGLAVETGA